MEKLILNSTDLFDFIPSKEGQGIQVKKTCPFLRFKFKR